MFLSLWYSCGWLKGWRLSEIKCSGNGILLDGSFSSDRFLACTSVNASELSKANVGLIGPLLNPCAPNVDLVKMSLPGWVVGGPTEVEGDVAASDFVGECSLDGPHRTAAP